MPSAYEEREKDKSAGSQREIASVMAALAGRQAENTGRKLTGPERAAVLMLALGEQHGAKVWSLLDDDELRELSVVMSTLGTIEASAVEGLLLEFVSRMSASGAVMGNYDATERLLQQYLPPERVGGIMEEIRGPAGRNMWEKLSNVQEEVLANYLKNEYPQTIAVVLSKMRPEHAARVLAILPEDLALDVVNRMLRMEAVQKEVIERVENTLRTEFMSNLSQTRRRDAHEVMAEIFNNFDRQTETRFMTALEDDNRESAERIKTLMFTFDDLTRLDTGSAQTLMRQIDKDKLAIALKGASEAVRQFFFSNMSTRAAKMLADDMAQMGPVRLRDVDEAQAQLVNLAKDLAAKGEIMISKSVARGAGLLMEQRPAKFLFDNDFAVGERTKSSVALAEHAAKLTEAEAAGYRKGFAAAKAEAEQRAAAALERVAAALAELNRGLAAVETRLETEAVEVAVAVARKLAPELIAREPFAEISALAADCFRHLVAAPHVVVRVNDAAAGARPRAARGDRARQRLRRPPGGAGRARDRSPATAASNGPTAASSATAPPSKARSTRRSPATSPPAAAKSDMPEVSWRAER